MFRFWKKPKPDAVIAALPFAIQAAAEKWIYFCETLPFKDEVPLYERIAIFSEPFFLGARGNIAALKDAPDAILLMIVAKGIERSGTHSTAEIEQALGISLPNVA